MGRALGVLALLVVLAGSSWAEGPPESGWDRANSVGRKSFDVVVLRPLQLGQLIASAAFFLPSYPVSLLFDGGDDVMEVCITQPYDRVFKRSLGDL